MVMMMMMIMVAMLLMMINDTVNSDSWKINVMTIVAMFLFIL